jgi:PAS domain S-box-containing protein
LLLTTCTGVVDIAALRLEDRVAVIFRPNVKVRVRGSANGLLAALDLVSHRLNLWHRYASSPRWRRLLSASVVSDQPWRLLVGACCVVVPAVLMGLVSPSLPVTTPGVVLLLAVAFSSYLADWVGGVTALVLASVALNVLFVGDRVYMSVPRDPTEALGFFVTLAGGAVLIWLIERVKRQSVEDRRAALAARSAATALASLETVAASQKPGDETGRRQLFDAVVRALVGIHRAHAGALFVASRAETGLGLAASYGFGADRGGSAPAPSIADQFARLVAQGHRPIFVDDVYDDPRFKNARPEQVNVHALLGAPVLGAGDKLLGVVMIGLLVRHRFTATEVAKLNALARQVAAIVETATVVDAREVLLKRAQDEQRRLELVIAALPEAVVLAAPPDGKIVAANDAAIALFGPLGDSNMSGRLRRSSGEVCPLNELPVLTALQTGEVAVGVELLARHANGTDVPVLASAAPVREPDGTIVAVVAVFRDIGALKQASRMKDEFVSVVSHELRSPLTPIRGFVQLVAKELDREGGHESHVQRLRSLAGHVDRMTRLVDDLLDVSRLRAGPLDIRRKPTDLVAVASDVVQVRAASGEHVLRLEPALPTVVGDWDSDRLQQVIDNLVGNAIKYSPPGGKISVSIGVDARTGEAMLTVADEGPGIPAEDRERIFAAFYRTRSAATSQVSGLGLGLYICHELVAAHGGAIEVGSSSSGGAAFTVRLPLVAQSLAA